MCFLGSELWIVVYSYNLPRPNLPGFFVHLQIRWVASSVKPLEIPSSSVKPLEIRWVVVSSVKSLRLSRGRTNLGLTGYERFPTSLKLIACLYRPGPQKGRWIIFQWKSGKFCCSFQGGFVVFVVRTSLDGNPVTTLKFHSYPIINPAGLVLLHAFRIWKLSDISISMYISIAEVSIWIMTLCFSPALNSLTPIHSPSLPSIASVQQEFFCLVSMHAIENGAISSARKKSSVSLSTSANGWRPGMKRSPIDELKRQVQGGGGVFDGLDMWKHFFLVVKLL